MADSTATTPLDTEKISFEDFKKDVLRDYQIVCESREVSYLGRREVLTGKAKFGIFGDGKEIAQIAMAKVFKNGDFRSGYYRDQTFMMATGLMTAKQFFAQLYAHTSLTHEPMTGGRQMNGHYATRLLDENGQWLPQTTMKNVSADVSPTAGQMSRSLGLALASKLYRQNKELHTLTDFSQNGNEVSFVTIGDASTSEGVFWETINAAAVQQVPLAVCVWDDNYGISVPKEYQTVKQSISKAAEGFAKNEDGPGFLIFTCKAWNYPHLIETFQKAIATCRQEHIPVLLHIEECTQPQGHSTSGSHERYKDKKRLNWEDRFDGIRQFRKWIEKKAIATEEELDNIETEAKNDAKSARQGAWDDFQKEILEELSELKTIAGEIGESAMQNIGNLKEPQRFEIISAARKVLYELRNDSSPAKNNLRKWLDKENKKNYRRYNDKLYDESDLSPLNITHTAPEYDEDAKMVDGRVIIRDNFDKVLANDVRFLAFGEDIGKIGGVNQTYEGLQDKDGELRVFDTGIREATIAGQGIGLAMRGLKPIAEIQYLDYVLYCLQTLSDDLATLHYRTKGQQSAPTIISTRGHRLEGIWHSGSPMGVLINALRGMYVCVPRNMTQAAGMYNTLLKGNNPALLIEPLNSYRLKEKYPKNIGEFTVPLGEVEILNEGVDITLVTYGSLCRIAQNAIQQLNDMKISVELIDVQTLLPFDISADIVKSIEKTNKVLFLDEDVDGGASAFIMQQVLEKQDGWKYLDAAPKTLTAKDHRPAYGSDGDYFSKPSADDIVEAVYGIIHSVNPDGFPAI